MNIKQKLTTSFAAGAIMLSAFAPAAFAAPHVNVSGNGAFSRNDVSLNQNHRTEVNQQNRADFNNNVRVNSNTGNNRSSFNTGGNTSIRTGDANTSVHVSNMANMNSVGTGWSGNGGSNGGGMMHHNGWKLNTFMTGGQEVPGPGDSNGWGRTNVTVHPEMGKLCVAMWVKNIAPATAAHIHEAPVGVSGPVVISLPTPDSNGYVNGCVTNLDSNELMEIKNDPSNYYVNVHNTPYPNGAVRGQLSR